MKRYASVIAALRRAEDPSIRLKIERDVLGEASPARLRRLEDEIRQSETVRVLLSERDTGGRIAARAYQKWNGPHWVLVMLAELGYPPGDEGLGPLGDQVYDWIMSGEEDPAEPVNGRYRVHASMHGNIVFATTRLGIGGARFRPVVERLLCYQWPDGGWNCDRRPEAATSSFIHTPIALRGLFAHAAAGSGPDARAAIARATDFMLARRLYKRKSTGEAIKSEFTALGYPYYHMYNVLFGLKIMGEGGLLGDARCADALDLLESKYLIDQGFKLEKKPYHHTKSNVHRYTPVRWEKARLGAANQHVTADALVVLAQSGRLG